MQSDARPVSFDARPLVEPVDRTAVRELARRMRDSGAVRSAFSAGSSIVAVIIGAVVFVMFGSVFLTMAASLFSAFLSIGSDSGAAPWLLGLGAFLPVVIVGGVLALIIVAIVRGTAGANERRYRLDRFAAANGMTYVPSLQAPTLPGMIFGVGASRASSDLVRGQQPRFVEFGNYQYTTGSGKNRTTHKWGYVAIKLDVPLPHIVLDATSNNGLFGASNLPASFDKDQRLRLEGDFDQHFSLYCPTGYERDALYLFTPDIMARFIDSAAALDVEIVDDWLFFYGKRDFSTVDPATWAWLFSAVAATLDKLAQWSRWRDERLRADAAASTPSLGSADDDTAAAGIDDPIGSSPGAPLPFAAPAGLLTPPPGVAVPGRRLTRRFSWVTVVVVVGFLLFWLLGPSGLFGALLFR
ncbi:MAG: hypothetical protein ABW091_15665 [Microbacterium sp.]